LKHRLFHRSRWYIAAAVCVAVVLLVALLPALTIKAGAANASAALPQVPVTINFERGPFVASIPMPPPDKYCRKHFGFPCLSPQEMHNAYDLNPLLNKGYDGAGQTIVIIVPFGSPTIQNDLHMFDVGYKLPDPPSFQIITPLGTKPYKPTVNRVNWATETTLDTEWSHAMAPGANIVLMTAPTANLLDLLFLEQYALNKGYGKIISQSWDATENILLTPNGRNLMQEFNNFYKQAADDHVTVFAASGDTGAANFNNNGKLYPFPTVNFPASDPYVTTIGGTSLSTDTSGNYQFEHGWHRSGGGVSQYWPEPGYQNGLNSQLQQILNGYRGLPDVAYNANPFDAILLYTSFPGQPTGWSTIGGTSEGPPSWSGILADGDQFAGHPLGFLNPDLYTLGENGSSVYHDITIGNNTWDGILGYHCLPGWDPVTGWGSPQATQLITALIQMGA
jgi:subtilase family serine protease